jgi:hypothetical protein
MRSMLLLVVVAVAALWPSLPLRAAGPESMPPLAQSQAVLDKTFTLNPNDASGMASDCFDVPYGVMLTVVALTLDEDAGDDRVSLVLKEGDLTRLKTSLSTNPTVMAGYAGAGTYCYWIGASHIHLDIVAPVRQARLTITADSNVGH